jgi:signal transduction histidine kinase
MELKPASVSLHGLVQSVAESLRPVAAEKFINLCVGTVDENLTVWADRDKVTQVLTNLISNAVKFTPARGGIQVSAQTNGVAWAEVTVSDTGPGIAPEEVNNVFQEFYQVRQPDERKFKGVGLGLAISKKLVEMHGGRIWVESELGKGCTFLFTMPTVRSQINVSSN